MVANVNCSSLLSYNLITRVRPCLMNKVTNKVLVSEWVYVKRPPWRLIFIIGPVTCIKSLRQIGFYCKVIDLCEKWPTTAIKSVISNSSFFLAGKPIINGCSVPLKLPFLFKKTFTPSCRKHDICYYRVSRVVTLQFQFPSLEPNASQSLEPIVASLWMHLAVLDMTWWW